MSEYKGPVQGLFTSPNVFSNAPPGSLAVAENVVFSALGVLAPRRGMGLATSGTFGSGTSRGQAMTHFGQLVVVQYDVSNLATYNAVTPAAMTELAGTHYPSTTDAGYGRMHFAQAANNLYLTTTKGIECLIGPTAAAVSKAGNPQGLKIYAYSAAQDGGGAVAPLWQTYDTAVSYRYEVCSKDAFGRISFGAPCGRAVVRNRTRAPIGAASRTATTVTVTLPTGETLPAVGDVLMVAPGEAAFPAAPVTVTGIDGTNHAFAYTQAGAATTNTIIQDYQASRAVIVDAKLPASATTSNFVRIFRSEMTLLASDTPSDDLYLCHESPYLTAGQISARDYAVTDVTPEAFLGFPMDCSANVGVGILQANYRPPVARDICYWQDRMWFGNTTSKHRLQLSLIGCGSPAGLQDGDTITIGGTLYTARTLGVAGGGTNPFRVYTAGSPPENLENTANDLVKTVNATAGNTTVDAYYVSGTNDVPGMMLFEERDIGGSQFVAISSRAACWSPPLPTSGTTVFSDNNRKKGGASFSPLGIPDACPVANELPIGLPNSEFLRWGPLNAKLFAFKDDGIFVVFGSYPFTVQKISNARLIANDSVSALGEKLCALTDQGIVAISDSGVTLLSPPIEKYVSALFGDSLPVVRAAFGLGYETDRRYICWLQTTEAGHYTAAANALPALCYSTLAQGFTSYTYPVGCAAVKFETDVMYACAANTNSLLVERKSHTSADYRDRKTGTNINVDAINGLVLTLASYPDPLSTGDALYVAGIRYPVISADKSGRVTLDDVTGITVGSKVDTYEGIACRVVFNPITGGDPAVSKFFRQASFLFGANEPAHSSFTFASEVASSPTTVALAVPGLTLVRIQPLDPDKSACAQLSVGVTIREAGAFFELLGIAVEGAKESEATR